MKRVKAAWGLPLEDSDGGEGERRRSQGPGLTLAQAMYLHTVIMLASTHFRPA